MRNQGHKFCNFLHIFLQLLIIIVIVVTIVAGACYKKVREFSNKIYDNSISFPSAIELPRNPISRLHSGFENNNESQTRTRKINR